MTSFLNLKIAQTNIFTNKMSHWRHGLFPCTFYKVKLQITLLKFGSVWILHLEVSKFEFYPPEVLGCLDFISWRFRIWILSPKVWSV